MKRTIVNKMFKDMLGVLPSVVFWKHKTLMNSPLETLDADKSSKYKHYLFNQGYSLVLGLSSARGRLDSILRAQGTAYYRKKAK